jgi:enoyl-CoA hydratase
MAYETILIEQRGRTGLITLNRPQALNALNPQLIAELTDALTIYDRDETIGAIVLTGSDKAFAAGADIKDMADKSYHQAFMEDFIASWDKVSRTRKPLVACVRGFALGGGCELAMMCDIIVAADTAKFGQPEINLGVIPGSGGTQRLTWAVGKSKAMDLILTGRMMNAEEAERAGLVARIYPAAEALNEALKIAETIAAKSLPSTITAKEAINRAFETGLTEGLLYERRVFHALFAFSDQKEGMKAFVEKRPPNFKHR